ncbi:MAG TPA: hypothetical protein VFQ85_08835 [Mycobacteriales bacterium]|nr:hypothetical protein [Mycobacteriales bacterium]
MSSASCAASRSERSIGSPAPAPTVSTPSMTNSHFDGSGPCVSIRVSSSA